MKKRVLAMLFAAMMVCGVAGCGGAEKDAETENTAQEEVAEPTKEEEMMGYLAALPEEIPVETAVKAGFFTIKDGAVAGGQEAWDAFIAASGNGEEASVILCQYTEMDGAVLDFLYYSTETGYLLVTDETRGGFEDTEEETRGEYYTRSFEVLKVFDDFSLKEGGTVYDICVLTNEAELDAATFATYWTEMSMDAHQTMLLYVI